MKNRIKSVYTASIVAALGGLLFGFDTGVISGALPSMKSFFVLNDVWEGITVSALIFGCIIGVTFSNKPGEVLGRKKTLLLTALLFFLSALGTALTNQLDFFILYRILGGIAVGTASVFSPLYISEIAPANNRGKLVALNQLAIVLGIALSFYSNYFLSSLGPESWRYMLGVMGVPALLFFISLWFVPESPRWLILKGNEVKALRLLKQINGEKEGEKVHREIILNKSESDDPPFSRLFSKDMRKVLIIGLMIAVFSQITGINAIMYYAPTIFKSMGASTETALWQQAIIGLVNLIFTVLAIVWIDRIGRKPLLITGVTVMLMSLTIIAVAFFMEYFTGYVVLISILLFIASFAASLGPVSWVLLSEIFPNAIRSKAMSISVLSLWLSNLFIAFTFPILRDRLGGGSAFLIFAISSLILLVFIMKYVPETKGKTLEELELELTK